MLEILHTLRVQGPPARIYAALTEQKGLASWWTRDCDAAPERGHVNRFRFHDGTIEFALRIEQIDAPTGVVWRCVEGHPEWLDTTVEFVLEPAADAESALVRFAHRGWASAEGILPNCSYDWARYLRSLKLYIERGIGNPHPEPPS